MHSLRTRITFLTICLIVITVSIVTFVSVLFIRSNERRESDQLLLLLCETGERNLDYYFKSIQKSVEDVSVFVEDDLKGRDPEQLRDHVERVDQYFMNAALKTNGVLTYYYRIDPAFTESEKGFWYTNINGEGYVKHDVTDIKAYDTSDTNSLVWFTVPKHTGEAVWLAPYITDNLDVRVISYNVPIYWRGRFIGVVGIELDYSTMAEQVESIRLYNNGYAFLNDDKGNLFHHPRIDVATLDKYALPEVPKGLVDNTTFIHYTFEGVEKHAAWLPLSNGMRLTVSAPVSETEGEWKTLIRQIMIVSAAVLLVMSIFTMLITKRITKPLKDLTEAAQLADQGNYDFDLKYDRMDEVGTLTRTFMMLTDHMRVHISDLNKRVYTDALTSVKNKGAFSNAIEILQSQIDKGDTPVKFAVGVFDCNNLKSVNDQYGHDKGDLYLKAACRLICKVFQHSPVFRIGGDEFSVILQNDDLSHMDELIVQFERDAVRINASTPNIWEHVDIAMGFSLFDPIGDHYVIDTVRRADKNMYTDKRRKKDARRS